MDTPANNNSGRPLRQSNGEINPRERQALMETNGGGAIVEKKNSIVKIPEVELLRSGSSESWWKRRTFLEKGLFCLSVLMCLLVVILLILLSTNSQHITHLAENGGESSEPHLVSINNKDVCVTSSCVQTSARLINSMDLSVRPCDDFFLYACGTWNKKHVIPEDRSNFNTFAQLFDDLQVILKTSRLISAMDRSMDPCEDFFQYACGTWNKVHVIPDDRSNFNTFGKLRDDLQVMLKTLLEEEVLSTDPTAIRHTKHLYRSCLNISEIETRGDAPLVDLLQTLGGWPILDDNWDESNFDWIELMANLRLLNNRVLINQWVNADDKNSEVNIIQMDQAQLGMPSRHYFLKGEDDPILQAYKQFAIDVAMLLGVEQEKAEAQMGDIIDFEIKLANITMADELRRDTESIYHKYTVRELYTNITDELDWLRYLNLIFTNVSLNVSMDEEVVIYTPDYMRQLAKLTQETPNRVIANYMLWIAIFNGFKVDPFSMRLQTAKGKFNKVFYGIDSERARWRTCVTYVNENFGMALGKMFVTRHFDENAKHTAEEMIQQIRDSFAELLKDVDWMDEDTREKAREKAEYIQGKIGFPDYIMNDTMLNNDYDGVVIDPHKYFENVLSNLNTVTRNNLKHLREPVDKSRWSTTPAVVNAFYSAGKNQIMFPAGILQPPFYSESYPKSLQYGGIGFTIGHEITHGFDHEGRQFDKDGNLQQWWSDIAIKKFKERAQCIVDQYSNFTVPEVNLNINGRQTQGENIADNGGLKQSFRAYRKWVAKQGKDEPLLPGLDLNHDQLFFLNFAQIWCGTARPESFIQAIRSGSHSPGRFRVIGSLSNSYDFSKAFNCPLGSPMNPKHKCSVW